MLLSLLFFLLLFNSRKERFGLAGLVAGRQQAPLDLGEGEVYGGLETQLRLDLRGRFRNDGRNIETDVRQRLGEMLEDTRKAVGVLVFLGQ